ERAARRFKQLKAAGQQAEVKFTVTNNGTETAGAAWTDAVYLSSSSTLDSSATQLGSFAAPGPLAAGASYTFDQKVTIPATAATYSSQNYFLLFVTNDNHAQSETDGIGGDDIANLAVTVAPAPPPPTPLPDLQMTSVSLVNDATSTATTNGQITVAWTVTNNGTAAVPANSNWTDYVYLSPTATYDSSTAIDLNGFSESSGSSGIAIGGNYSDKQSVTVPQSVAAGTYYLLVFANRYSYNLTESDNQAYGVTDTNNIGSTQLTVQSADLKMTAATVNGGSSATAAIGNGASLSLSETVENASASVTASGSWYDEVFLSTKQTYDSSALYLDTFYGEPNTLAPGNNYPLNDTLNIGTTTPNNQPLTPGSYYLLFVANAETGYSHLGESDNAGGQYADTNNVMALPLTLTAANVDLAIAGAPAPSTPATAVEGQSFPVSFNVTNKGTDTAGTSWTDAVYFSYKPTLDNTAVRLDSQYTPGSLAGGGSYTFSQDVTIPSSVYPGSGYLLLVTNDNHAQSESDAGNDTNDIVAEPITVSVADLAVTNVTAPSTAYLDNTVQVSWTVKNLASVPAPQQGWYDSIYISNEPTYGGYGADLTYLQDFSEAPSGLAAAGGTGDSYTDTQTVTIPTSARTGDVYLIVVTNTYSYPGQGDSNPLNDYYAVPIHLSVPNADLAVSNVQVTTTPSSPAVLGGSAKVSWTVTNSGTLAANANWVDDVFVSTKPTFDNTAQFVTYVNAPPSGSSPLAAGASYNDSATFTLGSYVPTGQVYFFVETNANAAQSVSDTTNAIGDSAAVTVSEPDLTVTGATAAGLTSDISAAVGQSIPVTWTVENDSSVEAPATWYDAVYISPDSTFDGKAQYLDSFDESSHTGLAGGATYTDSQNVKIPNVPLGQEYLLFVTDTNQSQPESDTTNDVFALPIALSAPDLAVTGATAPASATLGDAFQVSWTVANQGSVPALSTWADAVYVSNVSVLDATATLLHAFDESSHTNLAASGSAGNSYTDTETVTLPSTNIGARYLLFVTNSNGGQGEIDGGGGANGPDANDVFAVPISVTGADLAVTSPSAPSLAAVGAKVPVAWTVVNQGNATADASWHDAVYFSQKSFYDGSAVSAGSFAALQTPLAAGASYTDEQTITIPAQAANADYILIVANSDGRQAESDVTANGVDANDVVALPIQIASVDLAAASISGPASANFGDTVDVSWTVNTTSNLPIQADFSDGIYLSTKNTFDGSATLLTTVDEKSLLPIAENASYTQTAQVTIPLTASSTAGTEYLYVVVNDGQRIIETNAANNIVSTPISLSLPLLANLVPTSITLPGNALTGQGFDVSWTDQNNGNGPA
ncbi:MAG TPA: CARDB domain-containing protein, partial [Pirellulales bacterium]|nr:CARDB domain-containing protein [Pirellulales bacterium]